MSRPRRSVEARERRKKKLKSLATTPSSNALKVCTVFACGQPTCAASGKGLSKTLCASHVRHKARHGSSFLKSYRRAEMAPFIKAANRWLKAHSKEHLVSGILAALDGLMIDAPKPELPTRLRWLTAKQKASQAFARMRVRKVKPIRLAAIVLATRAIVEARGDRGKEWLQVQIARQAHRLAARFTPAGMEGRKSAPGVRLKHGHEVFPSSSGGILRELGRALDEVAGILTDKAVPNIIDNAKLASLTKDVKVPALANVTEVSPPQRFAAPLPPPALRRGRPWQTF